MLEPIDIDNERVPLPLDEEQKRHALRQLQLIRWGIYQWLSNSNESITEPKREKAAVRK